MTSPSENYGLELSRVQEKAQLLIDLTKNEKMSQRNLWFLLDRQFWPKVNFGVGTIAALFDELADCLHKQYYQLLPLGGIRRLVLTAVQYLRKDFFGSGCPHLGVEGLVKSLEKILQHFGCQTVVEKKLQISMELLLLEVGMTLQPFQLDYGKTHFLATDCWLK